MKIDEVDRKLIELLQEDAKLSINTMAAALNLTKTPVYERIKRLEREGVISKYVAIIDQAKISSSMVVFCSVSLESQNLKSINSFADAIEDIPEVMESYLLGGANDFMLKVIVEDLAAYHKFSAGKLAALPNVAQIKSTFVLHETKHTTVYPVKPMSA